jgi:signal peptidase II
VPVLFLVIGGVLLADQLSKIVVRSTMSLGSEIAVLPFFSLTHVDNTGIAFGMFQERNVFFIALGLTVTGLLVAYAVRLLASDRPSASALGVILGGAIGNLIDRVTFGRVTDFLDFYVGTHHWPVFNVADAAICVGAGYVALRSLLDWRAAARR